DRHDLRRRPRRGADGGGACRTAGGRAAALRPALPLLPRGAATARAAARRRAGDRLLRPVQRRQVVARERADRAERARPRVPHAGAHAPTQLLRPRRRPAHPRGHAGLWLRPGVQEPQGRLAGPYVRLPARPRDAAARAAAAGRADRNQGQRPAGHAPADRRRRGLPDRADQGRRREARPTGAAARGGRGAGAGPHRRPPAGAGDERRNGRGHPGAARRDRVAGLAGGSIRGRL
ncbi:MAG: GTP-binding protein EngB, partial [uncultured Acetobacteraceae bacterium]